MSGPSKELLIRRDELKNARIAELEATIERLKVCGSCHMWKPVPDADDTYCCTCIIIGADPARAFDTCNRWAERATP